MNLVSAHFILKSMILALVATKIDYPQYSTAAVAIYLHQNSAIDLTRKCRALRLLQAIKLSTSPEHFLCEF